MIFDSTNDLVPEGAIVDEITGAVTVEAAQIAVPIPTKEVFQSTTVDATEPWDGNMVYRYDTYTGTLQPALLSKIQSELGNSYLVTDPEDIRQILSWSDAHGSSDQNMFKIEFLYKHKDDRVSSRFSYLNLSAGILSMEECDFVATPTLTNYMNSAFK